jgi:hypothetical protein
VLDVGAGEGDASFYAACAGAKRVVSLELEAAGSRGGVREQFNRIRERLDAPNVELRPETIQEWKKHDHEISWGSFNTLRTPGRVLLGNRVALYFLTSTFRLRMSKAS